MTRSDADRTRAGVGYLIPLVAVILGGLLVILAATSLMTSTTALTTARVSDLRILLETCQSAHAGAVQSMRFSISKPGSPGADPFDWRAGLMPPYNRSKPGSRIKVPASLVERFDSDLEVRVSDVEIRVVDWFEPPDYAKPEFWPQGVLELAVTASIERSKYQVKRTVLQRRVFYVTLQGAFTGAAVQAKDVDIVVASNPLATVILP